MPDFAISPGTGHISDWGDREERKKRLIEDSCRNLDIVSDTCTVHVYMVCIHAGIPYSGCISMHENLRILNIRRLKNVDMQF